MDVQYNKDGGQDKPSPEITQQMVEAGAAALEDCAESLTYSGMARAVYLAMARASGRDVAAE
jgi:hypothetical protein